MTGQAPYRLEGPDVARGGAQGRLPRIEVVTSPHESASERAAPGRSRLSLLAWFAGAFALVLIPASLWNFSRPPVYQAAASVLTVVPEARSGAGDSSPDVQHVEIQRQLLLGRELLSDTLERVRDTDQASEMADPPLLTPDDLRPRLAVEPIPGTNLVELSATGGKPALLATLVNEWLAAYQDLRDQEIAEQVGGRLAHLDEQAASLQQRISEKRDALNAFRERHDIVTLERDSNQSLKRLKSLQDALAKAEDEAIQARARLRALRAAMDHGEVVVPQEQAAALRELQDQAATLRAAVAELNKRYTEMFIQSDPSKRAIPEQLARVEARLEALQRQGITDMVNQRRQDVEATNTRVLTLQREIEEQKRLASRFSASYAEYEDLKSDMESLEAMQRETENQRVALEAEGVTDYPQIEIIEPAYAPRDPVRPHYARDFGFSALGATAAGLMTLLALLSLDARRQGPRPSPGQVTGVRIWGGDGDGDAEPAPGLSGERPRPGIAPPPAGALPDASMRQLMGGEVEALWDLASPGERQLIGLLLSGLRADELAALTPGDFDLGGCTVAITGAAPRQLPLGPALCRLLQDGDPLPAWRDDAEQGLQELAQRIPLLAMDAGLAHAQEVDLQALRHTYLVYLVRQGARLTELHRIAGAMGAAEVQRYAPFSPGGASRPLEQIELIYPTLA